MIKKELVFATHNVHKAQEIQAILGNQFSVKTLTDIGIDEEIAETGEVLKENAFIKSSYVFKKTGLNVFSDDTGLEVTALNGAPGVFSARYSGAQKNDSDNINLLLKNLAHFADKSAQFHTVISLFWEGKHYFFNGYCKGNISNQKLGENGFGYDPIFIPEGYVQSFAQMSVKQKNVLSHRGRAIKEMTAFLIS
jgi:XTP/dITP diphosphohydrolase